MKNSLCEPRNYVVIWRSSPVTSTEVLQSSVQENNKNPLEESLY